MTPMASDLHADAAVSTAGQLLMELRSEVRTLDERMTERLVAVERKLDVMVAQDLHARIVALERAQWKLLSIWRYSIAGNSWATMAATPTAIGARRPQVTVVNRFPAGLARDVGDRITLRWPSVRPVELAHYRILGITTVVSEAGQRWETTYATEELAT